MRGLFFLILLTLGLMGPASAQGVRSLGMGGLILPGPGAVDLNPAYAAYPSGFSEGGRLPLGLLRLLPVFPETSPLTYFTDPQAFRDGFDALSFYDQMAYLDQFLLNPARSPDEVVFHIGADRIEVTDGQGNPLNLNFQIGQAGGLGEGPTALYPTPLFWIPLKGGNFSIKVGPFWGLEGLSVYPSPELAQALTGDLDACKQTPSPCTLTFEGRASAGVALALSWAGALPKVEGVGGIYLGVKGEGFYGLAYGETTAEARPAFDQDGQLTGAAYNVKGFYVLPDQGRGYGLRADFGVALEIGEAVLGLGVQNLLGYALWEGRAFQFDESGSYTEAPDTRTSSLSAPSFFVNGAYRFKDLLLGADARFGSTALTAHLGGEYALGPVRLRGGIGYEGGFRFGLGAGFELGRVGLDLALTTHEAPLVGGTVYGVAADIRF